MVNGRLAARFLNRPLALLPSDAAALLDMVQTPSALVPMEQQAMDRDYSVAASVAVIPIMGALSHGTRWSWFDETSYDSIRRSMAHAVGNDEAKAIAMHINSPGGDCAGMFDLCDAISSMRGEKPIWAILNENAYSAAYGLASCADFITVPRSGGTGSIGCIQLHANISGMLDKVGVEVTTIQFGDRKADFSPYAPLKGAALAGVQSAVDTLGEMFVDLVARNRNLSAKKVRATEAATFMGADGVSAGLADAVMSPDEAFLSLVESLA